METEHTKHRLIQVFQDGEKLFLPHISVDNVIFAYEEGELQVLLLEVGHDMWMLPGGYLYKTESLDAAAKRNVFERIGLDDVFLKQFHVFGNEDRSFKKEITVLFEQLGVKSEEELWIYQRFVSVGYYALVDKRKTELHPHLFAKSFRWQNVYELPALLLDHEAIITKALEALRRDLKEYPIAYHVLPTKFTMPELHKVFETVNHKPMDRSRFQKKMFGYAVFERLDRKGGVAHRRPYFYRHKDTL